MEHMKHMVDMAKSPLEAVKDMMPSPDNASVYPYGLCIRLTQDELEKLDVDHADWQVGDIFHLHALGKVTSISSHEREGGNNCCVEIQLTHLSGESEDAENEEEESEDGNENEEDHEEESEPSKKKGRPNVYF